jgi:hypothetical protein
MRFRNQFSHFFLTENLMRKKRKFREKKGFDFLRGEKVRRSAPRLDPRAIFLKFSHFLTPYRRMRNEKSQTK